MNTMHDAYLPCRGGPFLIEAEIRRGAPDITYRAVHEPTQQPVHLVVARSDRAFEEGCARRAEEFEAEAAALAQVSHPALTRILGAGVLDARPYLALAPLAGQGPFHTDNLHALMRMVLCQRPKPPHKVARHVPRKLSRLVLRCLAKELRDRPATAAELAAELRAFA